MGSLAGDGDSLVSEGRCKHYTKNHAFCTREFLAWLKLCVCVSSKNHLHIWHAMSHGQSLLFLCLTSSAHSICTPNPTSLLFPSHGDDHCDQPRHGATCVQLAESKLPTSHEPYDLAEMNNTEITPIFFHRPSVTSTYDSSESIATLPLESYLDDEQIRNMRHHCTYRREASADRSRVFHFYRENSVTSSSRVRASAVRPAAVFSHNRKSSQGSHSDIDSIPLAHRAVQRGEEAQSRLSESENETKRQRPEEQKQDCRAEFLDCSILEFHREIHSRRMEADHVNLGYETSRREQARLHEESAQRERALR